VNIDLGQLEKFFKRDFPLSIQSRHQFDPGAKRHQGGRCGRGVNDGAALLIEDCMVLVLAAKGEARFAPFARAMVM
jgi:hypothetical protein